ncbi:hypothetical protein ACFOYU_06130 [Microvirga sp. GCM10011540]|uniref:hypothetical protein n=1 Tax=Microvirga sp. GCM10011540 TaxID=3317338 RepID=UPI00361C0804
MITVHPYGTVDRHRLDAEIDRLETLLGDMKRLRDGGCPSVEELAAAPSIDQWSINVRPAPCLVGLVQGHPRTELPTLRPVATSDLWILDPARSYARTLSRIYALGLARGERTGSIQ